MDYAILNLYSHGSVDESVGSVVLCLHIEQKGTLQKVMLRNHGFLLYVALKRKF